MERLITENLTSDEGFAKYSDILPVNWESVTVPFSTTEVVNVSSQDWTISETQLDSRPTHRTYKTSNGQLVHWKEADGLFEPLYEGVANELGPQIGASFSPTSPAFLSASTGTLTFGVVSLALFAVTLISLSETEREIFFGKYNKTLFVAETVLAVWWRNFDWSNKFDSVAFGVLDNSSNILLYYTFDHSHIYSGPRGENDEQKIRQYNLLQNLWQKKYLNFSLSDCLPFIEKIEQLPNDLVRSVCTKWATKIGALDTANFDKYSQEANKFAEFLITSKNSVRRELDLFLQGAAFAS